MGTPVRALSFLVFLLVFALPLAAAQDEGNGTQGNDSATPEPIEDVPAEPQTVEVTILGHAVGGQYYFTVEGEPGRNPTLTFPPGTTVIFTVISDSGYHNLQVEGFPASEYVDAGDATTYTITLPDEEGTYLYFCVPHKSLGMQGRIRVATETPGGGGQPGGDGLDLGVTTGDTIDLGDYDPACAGIEIPAVVAEEVTGGPTVQDYVAICKAGGLEVAEGQAPHPADWVIPLSWLLIGLGLVGVVWVHKYYKP